MFICQMCKILNSKIIEFKFKIVQILLKFIHLLKFFKIFVDINKEQTNKMMKIKNQIIIIFSFLFSEV